MPVNVALRGGRDRKGLMVVGVGARSGASGATQIVAGLGLRLPSDLLPGNYANTQGYFESATLMQLCDRALDDLFGVLVETSGRSRSSRRCRACRTERLDPRS